MRDIFSGGTVPDSVCTPEFMHSCMNALKSEGLFLINAASAPTSQVQAQFAALAQISDFLVISDAAVARGKRRGNLVLVARKTGLALKILTVFPVRYVNCRYQPSFTATATAPSRATTSQPKTCGATKQYWAAVVSGAVVVY